jgi:hypothetical protein
MTTTATDASTARPRRRAPVWISVLISIFNACTAAVVLWFYALPSGLTYLTVLYALLLVVAAVTVWALASNRPRLVPPLLAATVVVALLAAAIWVAILAFIALALLARTARAARLS